MPGGDESIARGRRLQVKVESTCVGCSEGRRVTIIIPTEHAAMSTEESGGLAQARNVTS